MISTRLLFLVGLGIAVSKPAFAQDAQAWIGAPDCRLAAVKPLPAQPPKWSGACKDGYADGKGVLEWRNKDGKTYALEASFAAGQVQSEGKLRYPDGAAYTGTVRNGVPDGQGYVRYADGGQYEGGFRMGQREGTGESLYTNGDDYKGQWRQDKREGAGTITYGLGGSYEGDWKDNKPSGQGKLLYAGGQGREVATVDGRDPNRPAPPVSDKKYAVTQDTARTGSMFKRQVAHQVPVPPDRGYEQLTPEQQAIVKSWWPALAPDDEPPYPLHGPAELYKLISRIAGRLGEQGAISVYVTVSKEGKATRVLAAGLDDAELRKFIATAAAAVKYQPARCAGQPCEMAYPYRLDLTLTVD